MHQPDSSPRWEPPKPQEQTPARKKRRTRPALPFSLFDISEAWIAILLRLFVLVFAVVTVLSEALRADFATLYLILIVSLTAAAIGSHWQRMMLIRNVALVDLLTLGLALPLLVMNGFVAAAETLTVDAERTAYNQTLIAAGVVLVFLAAGIGVFSRRDAGLGSILMLPAALSLPALTMMLDDLRNQTILIAVVLAYTGGLVSLVFWATAPVAITRWAPIALFLGMITVGILSDPGFQSLEARDALVQTWHSVFMILTFAGLLALTVISRFLEPHPGTRRPRY